MAIGITTTTMTTNSNQALKRWTGRAVPLLQIFLLINVRAFGSGPQLTPPPGPLAWPINGRAAERQDHTLNRPTSSLWLAAILSKSSADNLTWPLLLEISPAAIVTC